MVSGEWGESAGVIRLKGDLCPSCNVAYSYEAARTFLSAFYSDELDIECATAAHLQNAVLI